jgi:transcriptional regulator with XRE-family HTH domain
MIIPVDDFIIWLNNELQDRGWSYNQAATRAGFASGATISMVATGRNAVTWEFCAGLARALNFPPEDVFRKAGLLRPVIDPVAVQQVTDLARHLSADNLALFGEIGRLLYRRQKQEGS